MARSYLRVQNGILTEDDFIADTPPVGSSDQEYSKEDLKEMERLAAELAATKKKG